MRRLFRGYSSRGDREGLGNDALAKQESLSSAFPTEGFSVSIGAEVASALARPQETDPCQFDSSSLRQISIRYLCLRPLRERVEDTCQKSQSLKMQKQPIMIAAREAQLESSRLIPRRDSGLSCRGCRFRTLWLSVIRYLVSPSIPTHGLGQTAHRAWSSVANADAPLAYELATALTFGGHRVSVLRLAKGKCPTMHPPTTACPR